VQNAPFSRGDIAFSACNAPHEVAEYLGLPCDTAVFVVDRTTWDKDSPITSVRLHYAPGYQLYTAL
jgi:GntR family histidine utilization transcriptional repressor